MTVHVLGIDPGLRATGWAVLVLEPARGPALGAAGVITTKPTPKRRGFYQADDDARAIDAIARGLEDACARWSPVAAAVEVPAGGKGSRAVRAMAMAHTTAVLVARAELGVLPLSIQIGDGKRAATGDATASKEAVAEGVRRLLGTEDVARCIERVPPRVQEHALDAMAVALAALDADAVRLALRAALLPRSA